MNIDSFKVQFASMISEFGNEQFHNKSAEELWMEINDLPEKEAVSVFEWARTSFKKSNPPAVADLIRKSKTIKYIEQKRIESLNLGPDPRETNTGAYENMLQQFGTKSLAEAIVLGKHKALK